MFKNKETKPTPPRHTVSLKGFGMSLDGQGLGVVVVPIILLIISFAGMTLGNGAAWLARLSAHAVATNEAERVPAGTKD